MTDEIASTSDLKTELLIRKVSGCASCLNCAYLYFQDAGYSNWTVEETQVECAKDANRHLPERQPWDWNKNRDDDNWPLTRNSLCERAYLVPDDFDHVHLDVDGETKITDFDLPDEVLSVFRSNNIG